MSDENKHGDIVENESVLKHVWSDFLNDGISLFVMVMVTGMMTAICVRCNVACASSLASNILAQWIIGMFLTSAVMTVMMALLNKFLFADEVGGVCLLVKILRAVTIGLFFVMLAQLAMYLAMFATPYML